MMEFLMAHKVEVLGLLLGLSELLALLPGLKANGILHGVIGVLKALGGKKEELK